MACNCRKPKPPKPRPSSQGAQQGTTQQFSLERPSGEVVKYGSRLEAEAQFVRDGREGTIKTL